MDKLLEADWIDRDRRYGMPGIPLLSAKPKKNEAKKPAKDKKSEKPSAVPLPPPKFSWTHTEEVIDRAKQLTVRLRVTADASRLTPLAAELESLGRRVGLWKQQDVADHVRREAYLDACRLARKIAWCNPLLAIDKLLFIKRHHPGGVFHMCDQFYGFNARPGGSLFVLEDPLGAHPRLVDLLAGAVVTSGRLKGRTLQGCSVVSPSLSFDGRSILFAASECQGRDLEWKETSSYHLFKIRSDGTDLVQLTDGPTNDFDPCWLPGGRIALISERRGGYLRCGRCCPTYTLFSMAADGSDITCLSFHETHEWQPSVDNHGKIVYTRWDYVDRDSDVAHHLWTCFPDGRDPRAMHGNYPDKRESRPWIENDIRAIPGSSKYVATAGAHHGHALGSLILIDVRGTDDNACSQLTRLTPEVPFPESEGEIVPSMVYGAAWPLSEDDYLCMYDAGAKNHGIYWIDRFGNKELVYRDPAIPCFSPIPLRPRPLPPVLPEGTQSAMGVDSSGKTTVAVMNVYKSDFAWPADTKIAALRIVQVLAKSTAPPDEPRIGIARQTNARAVLGTVPVESDGSAYFEAPPGKAIYFQAIDPQGLAIQSMRSATYLHPGEQLVCQGCHESKHQSATSPLAPLALRRGPSPIRAEADGSNPFNYVRLVQPVLDRHCVACHQEKKTLDLTGIVEGKFGWTRSYTNLAGKYGFYFTVYNGSIREPLHGGSRTTAGQFGARAAKLLDYLGPKHYGVQISDEDAHRVTLWLDCNSEFYGSYENTAAQSRGEIVRPTLE